MRTILLATAALALAACGGEPAAPVAPVPEAAAPEAAVPAPAPAAMDENMMAADAADDANTAETPDGYMFHTDLAKIENVHLPTQPGSSWTATVVDPTQAEVSGATDEKMADGSTHHVVQVRFLKRDIIARVKFERRDSADTNAPVAETRTINFMVH
jgi:hypothetical protein